MACAGLLSGTNQGESARRRQSWVAQAALLAYALEFSPGSAADLLDRYIFLVLDGFDWRRIVLGIVGTTLVFSGIFCGYTVLMTVYVVAWKT